MGMPPMADLKAMKADHRRQEALDKQRADAKGSIADPLEVDDEDNDNDNDKREDELFSDDSNADHDKGYRPIYANDPDDNDPDDNDPGGDDDPDED